MGMGPHRATIVHMQSLEAKLATKAAYEFAKGALANDGRIDCAEAERLLLLLETAYGEALEAKQVAQELDDKFAAFDAALRTDGHEYSTHLQKKFARVGLQPIRSGLNVTELYPDGPRPDGSKAA